MLTPGRKAVNSPVRIAANFQDDMRTDIDPDTVTFKIMSPSGTIASYAYGTDAELVKASTGDTKIIVKKVIFISCKNSGSLKNLKSLNFVQQGSMAYTLLKTWNFLTKPYYE